MEQILISIAQQSPNVVALIIVVWIFVKAIEKRDALYMEQMRTLAKEIEANHAILVQLSTSLNKGMDEMHRTVANRRKVQKKGRTA